MAQLTDRYLEVTFRRGKPFAAYLYLPRAEGDRAARSIPERNGVVVDYAPDGRPIGIELTAPGRTRLEDLNAILARLGVAGATRDELVPLAGAGA